MLRTALIFITFITVGFAPLIEGGTTYLPVFILHLLVLLMLAVWLMDGFKNGRMSLGVHALDLTAMAFFAVSLAATFIAPYKYMALIWVQIIFYYLLFLFLSREALKAPGGTGYAVLAVVGMGAVESVWGVGQWLHGMGRPTGSFFNPDMLAGYLTPSILLAASLAVFGGGTPGENERRGRLAMLLSLAVLCLAVVILTGSRGGVLALCAGGIVVLWARFGRRSLALVAAALALVLLIPNPVRDRVINHDPFAYSRAGIWKSSLDMIWDHPQGVGLGNFKYVFTRYNFPVREAVIKYGKVAGTAHNEYLHIGAEMGLIGLFVFIAGIFLLIKTLRRSIKASSGSEYMGLAVGLAGGITATLVHALVDANLHEPGIAFMLILLVSLALGLPGVVSRDLELRGGTGPSRFLLFTAFIALMAVFAAMPAAAYYYSSRAKTEARGGDMKSAMTDVDTALFIEPGNASYHSQKAALDFSLYQRGGGREDFTGAVAELEEAIRLNPGDLAYQLLISGIEYGYAAALPQSVERTEGLRAALGHAEKAVELAPNAADALMSEARVYIAMGDAASAVRALERLRESEPNYLRGRLLLAECYGGLGKTGLSKREYYNIIEAASALKGARLAPEESEFVKIDQARLDVLGKKLGVLN